TAQILLERKWKGSLTQKTGSDPGRALAARDRFEDARGKKPTGSALKPRVYPARSLHLTAPLSTSISCGVEPIAAIITAL
ncbi:hypothetical protein FRC20_000844, partial [Serendipita sp. 405]